MSPLELSAAAFGAVAVYLSTRENIWAWPVALVNVALYSVVFFEARLYADMGLQIVYFVLSAYGWFYWNYGGNMRQALPVSRATRSQLLWGLAVGAATWLVLGAGLSQTDAAIPWLDSLLTSTSLIAQWMLTRKLLENWALWFAVDLVYVPTFIARGLYPTAALYAVFLILAVVGWRQWKISLHNTLSSALTPNTPAAK